MAQNISEVVIWEKPVSLLSLHSQKQLTYTAIQTREKCTVHVHESYGWFVTLMTFLRLLLCVIGRLDFGVRQLARFVCIHRYRLHLF